MSTTNMPPRFRWKSLKQLILDKLAELNPEFRRYKESIRRFSLRRDSETTYTIDFTSSGLRLKGTKSVTLTMNKADTETMMRKIGMVPNTFMKSRKNEIMDWLPEGTIKSYDELRDSIVIQQDERLSIGNTLVVDDTTTTFSFFQGTYYIPLLVEDKVDMDRLASVNRLALSVADYVEPRDDI